MSLKKNVLHIIMVSIMELVNSSKMCIMVE